jgi:hypothetical protein
MVKRISELGAKLALTKVKKHRTWFIYNICAALVFVAPFRQDVLDECHAGLQKWATEGIGLTPVRNAATGIKALRTVIRHFSA